jgi:ComF family protein
VAYFAAISAAWLRILAPPRCPACDLPLEEDRTPFCAACWPLLERGSDGASARGSATAAFLYGGPLADAIVRFKYGGRAELAAVLGALLAEAALPLAGHVDCAMPMPLYPARLRERGFNQSALLAGPVARALGVPLDAARLRRIRPTVDQAGLAREGRADNVRGAFVARRLHGAPRVLLIDDVRTTGATLAAASQALLAAGASEVRTLVLARAEG